MTYSTKNLHYAIVFGLSMQSITGVASPIDGRNYTELSKTQAAAHKHCQPDNFNQWYLLNEGEDIAQVLSELTNTPDATDTTLGSGSGSGSLPTTTQDYLSTILPSSTQTTGISPSSLSNAPVTPSPLAERKKRQAETTPQSNEPARIEWLRKKHVWPPQPRSSTRTKRSAETSQSDIPPRIQLILRPSDTPYTISRYTRLDNISVGLCTLPSSTLAEDQMIPWEDQAVIRITDDFENCNRPAFRINEDTEFVLNSVRVDAYDWTSDHAVFLFYENSRGTIHNSTIIRLKIQSDPDDWHNDYAVRSIILADGFRDNQPTVNISHSRLYQGMEKGAIIFAKWGGNFNISDSDLIISDGGAALNVSNSHTELIRGSTSGCDTPITPENYANLGRPATSKEEFCPEPVADQTSSAYPVADQTSSAYSAYYGINNVLNFQEILFQDSWSTLLPFCDDRLATGKGQNLGNRLNNFHGTRCSGFLKDGSEGAVGFEGLSPCPEGSQLSNSQTGATEPPGTTALSTTPEPPGTTALSTTPLISLAPPVVNAASSAPASETPSTGTSAVTTSQSGNNTAEALAASSPDTSGSVKTQAGVFSILLGLLAVAFFAGG